MITKIAQNIKALLKDPSRSFKERVFILLTMVTELFIILALIGDIILGGFKHGPDDRVVPVERDIVFLAVVAPLTPDRRRNIHRGILEH